MSNIKAIDEDAFESEVVQSQVPVLVDFWAEWCGPCKALSPILDEIASNYTDKVKFLKMDVDKNTQLPPKLGVRGIPTLILFKNGQVQATQVGLISKADLIKFIDSNI